jgi:hypothetical protein
MPKEIVRSQPDGTDALYLLAEISYGSGIYDAAVRYVLKAIEYDPASAEAYCTSASFCRTPER